jgi:hypothetical protein
MLLQQSPLQQPQLTIHEPDDELQSFYKLHHLIDLLLSIVINLQLFSYSQQSIYQYHLMMIHLIPTILIPQEPSLHEHSHNLSKF